MPFSRPICRVNGFRGVIVRTLASLFAVAAGRVSAIDIPVDVLDDPVPNGCSTGSCSLREAVTLANALSGPDRILLPATPGLPLQLSIPGSGENANATGDLNVLDDLEIVGTGVDTTILVQTAQDRVLRTSMAVGKKLTLRGLTIEGGNSGAGGAVSSTSLLTIEDAALIGNHATFEGGAIHHGGSYAPQITEPRLVLRRVTFRDNVVTQTSGTGQGGAIYANSTFQGSPYLLVEDCVFDNNQAKSGGGAILLNGSPSLFGGTAVIRRSTFSGNRSSDAGGAALSMPFTSFVLAVEDSVFESNVSTSTSDYAGGAIDLGQVTSTKVVRTTFSGNSGRRGGAISTYSPMQIIDSHFLDNSAAVRGGAVSGGSNLLVERSTFESNKVTTTDVTNDGGGAIAFAGDVLGVQRSTFSDNDAYRGGAISLVQGVMQLYGSTLVAPAFGIAGRAGTALRIRDDTTASLAIANTILAGSCQFPSSGRQLAIAYNNIESAGSTCRLATAALGAQNHSAASSAELHLAALADNGGPTPTRMPLADSIAIDQGRSNYCTAADQRHFVGADANCDIGAVEAGATMDVLFSDGFDPGH